MYVAPAVSTEAESPQRGPKIVAITAWPTGVAHTFMAAEALQQAAKPNISKVSDPRLTSKGGGRGAGEESASAPLHVPLPVFFCSVLGSVNKL